MVNFDQAGGENKPRLGHDDDCRGENCDDEFDQPPEKKRRLTAEQVQFLEKSFDVDNKLEPDRKIQLAKDLGLHPRQVAIWFQNRRARYKTKLLEKDYDSLKSSYHKLKADYDNLFSDNEKLKNEVHLQTMISSYQLSNVGFGLTRFCISVLASSVEPEVGCEGER